jgi:hypothetical protein
MHLFILYKTYFIKFFEKVKFKATNHDFLFSPKMEKLALYVFPGVIGYKLYLIFPPKSKDVYSRERRLEQGGGTFRAEREQLKQGGGTFIAGREILGPWLSCLPVPCLCPA